MTIIIKPSEQYDQKTQNEMVEKIEAALSGYEVNLTNSDEALTDNQLLSMIAYNTERQRVYIGRLERNTRQMREEMVKSTKTILPLSALAEYFYNLFVEGPAKVSDKRLSKFVAGVENLNTRRKELIDAGMIKEDDDS